MYNKQLVSKSVDHLGHIKAHTNKVNMCVCSLYDGKRHNPKGVFGERISENGSGSFF